MGGAYKVVEAFCEAVKTPYLQVVEEHISRISL
jgi:hypothetical protein